MCRGLKPVTVKRLADPFIVLGGSILGEHGGMFLGALFLKPEEVLASTRQEKKKAAGLGDDDPGRTSLEREN